MCEQMIICELEFTHLQMTFTICSFIWFYFEEFDLLIWGLHMNNAKNIACRWHSYFSTFLDCTCWAKVPYLTILILLHEKTNKCKHPALFFLWCLKLGYNSFPHKKNTNPTSLSCIPFNLVQSNYGIEMFGGHHWVIVQNSIVISIVYFVFT